MSLYQESRPRLSADLYDYICRLIYDATDFEARDLGSNRSKTLFSLSLVSKDVRDATLRWIFRDVRWRTGTRRDFLPSHIRPFVRVLWIIAYGPTVNYTQADQEWLRISFSQLHQTASLKLVGPWGASRFLTNFITLIPALRSLECINAPFLDPGLDFHSFSGIVSFVYRGHSVEGTADSLGRLDVESSKLAALIKASAPTLTHLEIPGATLARFDLLKTVHLPSLDTFIIVGFAPPMPFFSPLTGVFKNTPSLRTLEVRLTADRTRVFEVYPMDFELQHIPNFHSLHSLTLYNPSPQEGLLHFLPSNLQQISLVQHPYPQPPPSPSSSNLPQLRGQHILSLLRKRPSTALRGLYLGIRGGLSAGWFMALGDACPRLETFQLHYWPEFGEDIAQQDLDNYLQGMTSLSALRRLRLDLNVNIGSMTTESMLRRAQLIVDCVPTLKEIGFMLQSPVILSRGLAWNTLYVVRDADSNTRPRIVPRHLLPQGMKQFATLAAMLPTEALRTAPNS